jgi:tetratricopeptide (TPR) repeat protein
MRDTIAWSYDLLAPTEQRLFRRLCVFTGGFDHAAAEAIADQKGGGLLDLLTGLARHNMLRPLAARMTILETIKEYGLEQLDGEGETQEVLARHARYFADLVADRADDGRLEDDLDNVRAALSWAVTTEHAPIALDIGGALWPFWSRRGQLTEGRRWLDAILRLPETDTNVELAPARTRVLVGATTLAVDQGAFEAAETWCPRAVEAARGVESRSDLMLALTAQGLLARHRSRYGEAAAAYEEALALATDLDDVPAAARISVGLSYVASVNGDLDKAARLTERASAAARELPDPRTRADILQMLAWLAFHRGQPDRVETTGQEALALYRELRETGQIAETLRAVGASASTYGRYRHAEALLAESYALHRDRGDEFRAGLVAAVQAHAALNIDDVAHAARLADLAVTITRRFENPWPIAMSLLMAGHVALATADIDRAVGLLAEAAELMSVLNSPLYLSWCVEGVIEVAVGRGDWELAARARGVRDALLARTGSQLPPVRPAAFDRVVELMRADPKPTDDPIGDLRQIIAELLVRTPSSTNGSPA